MRALMLLAALPLAACSFHNGGDSSQPGVAASGHGTARTFDVAGFTAVDLRGSDDADIRVGPAFSVRAEGPSDRLDDLRIVKDGDTLKIGRKPHGTSWGGGGRNVRIFVTMPALASAGVAGSGSMTVDRVDGGSFSGAAAGSGNLTVHRIEAGAVALSIAGSGNIAAAGTADSVKLSIAGSGDIDAGGLTAGAGDVSIAGSGSVKAVVNGRAKVSMMGSGDVDLGNGATCTVSRVGSGEVRCGH